MEREEIASALEAWAAETLTELSVPLAAEPADAIFGVRWEKRTTGSTTPEGEHDRRTPDSGRRRYRLVVTFREGVDPGVVGKVAPRLRAAAEGDATLGGRFRSGQAAMKEELVAAGNDGPTVSVDFTVDEHW